MSHTLAEFLIRVLPSPETDDFEVCLLADGENLIERFSSNMIGLDPGDLLVEPCTLRAQRTPHTATIGRCNCGVIGCGSVQVDIRRNQDFVTLQALNSVGEIGFLAAQYDAEVERALGDFSWETPDRTAARLIAKTIDRTVLEEKGLAFSWASGRFDEGMMTVAFVLNPGPYQVLVKIPWDGKSVESIVDRFRLLLRKSPESWPNVECYPQVQGLGPPPVGGPGWRGWVP
jgi:hypothetical protein